MRNESPPSAYRIWKSLFGTHTHILFVRCKGAITQRSVCWMSILAAYLLLYRQDSCCLHLFYRCVLVSKWYVGLCVSSKILLLYRCSPSPSKIWIKCWTTWDTPGMFIEITTDNTTQSQRDSMSRSYCCFKTRTEYKSSAGKGWMRSTLQALHQPTSQVKCL